MHDVTSRATTAATARIDIVRVDHDKTTSYLSVDVPSIENNNSGNDANSKS